MAKLGEIIACSRCGEGMPRLSAHHRYCAPCKRKIQNDRTRERHRRLAEAAGKGHVLGGSFTCVGCGEEHTQRNWMQKRCEPCSAEFKKAYLAEYQKEYYRRKQDALGIPPRLPPKEKLDKARKSCRCGACEKEFLQTGRPRLYCSEECSTAARRARDREKQRLRRLLPKTEEEQARAKLRWTAKNRSEGHRAYIRRYGRSRTRNDPKFAVHRRMKAMIGNALRSKKGGRSWPALVGYTTDDLMRHLERQFLAGMTWENRSKWHIDHILPVSSFNFSAPEDPEFIACWALSNLRPLWGIDNIKKKNTRIHLL